MAPHSESVNVVVRCRPLNERELSGNETAAVQIDEANRQVHLGDAAQTFTFDSVFGAESEQADLFATVAQPIVEGALSGYNGTIFAYGQTGTGKTYTMDGGEGEQRGIIPRAFEHVFKTIEESGFAQCIVQASFLEIYMEEFRDLLKLDTPSKDIRVVDSGSGAKVHGASKHPVTSCTDLAKLLETGLKARKVASQKMNNTSSRSHAVFTVSVECCGEATGGHVRTGCLNLVDLAGSEKQKDADTVGARLEEAKKINMGLSVLGRVITALVRKTKPPYRDSKLTFLLKDSLGGNTKTAIIANVSPASGALTETASTLRYANEAKKIKNKPVINEDPKDAELSRYAEEMKRLQAQLEGAAPAVVPATLTEADVEKLRQDIAADLLANATARGAKLSDAERGEIEREAQAKAEARRTELEDQAKAVEAEAQLIREKAAQSAGNVEAKQAEADRLRAEKEAIAKRLAEINRQIMRSEGKGGASLVEDARKREERLQQHVRRLEARRREEKEMEERVSKQEEEALMREKEYQSLDQQVKDTQAKFKKLHKKYKEVTREVEEQSEDWLAEKDEMMALLGIQRKQADLKELMIELFIPEEERSKVFNAARWCEDAEVWRIDTAAAAKKAARPLKRPVSASGLRRPTTDFTREVNAAGNLNPRFRSENILSLELDLPERTTFDWDDLVGAGELQEAINMVYPEEQDVTFVGEEFGGGRGPKYLDAAPASPASGEIKAVSASPRPASGRKRPGSARARGAVSSG